MEFPQFYIDPSGYYSTVEGMAAHVALQSYFMTYYSSGTRGIPRVEYQVLVFSNASGLGRADMVLQKGALFEVYEIKPISYHSSPALNLFAQTQINSYVTGINSNPNTAAVRGGSFSTVANMLKLPYPGDASRIITYYTYPNDPGMIYYSISSARRRQPQPYQYPAVVTNDSKFKVNADDVCKGVAIAGGTVAVGYVIYRVVRLIPSCTPWTFWTLPANLAIP